MTMWLVELMLVAKVYLRTLVPRCPLMEVCDPPPQSKKIKGVVTGDSKVFRFGSI